MPRFGTIALAGRPNAGKSTLLNALVGQQLAITSGKPQSTRQPVAGLLTEGDVQLAFVDLPGLFEPGYALQHAMVRAALETLHDADAILILHPVTKGLTVPTLPELLDGLPDRPSIRAPTLAVITQADRVPEAGRPLAAPGLMVISAQTGDGLPDLVRWCREAVPEGTFRYPADDISTQPMRFFATEYVREAAFELLEDELPYAITADVEEFREDSDPVYIRIVVHVERESQRGIVVGRGGRTIKQLGTVARKRIEEMLERHVFLELRVKVLPKWRSSPKILARLGFPTSPRKRT